MGQFWAIRLLHLLRAPSLLYYHDQHSVQKRWRTKNVQARKLLLYSDNRLEHFNQLFHLSNAREVELHDSVLYRGPTRKLG